jgi:FlaA1/EpsC-like NDP-sugar epimerase
MRNRYVLLADLVAIAFAAIGAFVLRFDLSFLSHRREFGMFLITVLCVKPAVFYVFGLYRRYWRYTSVSDLRALTLASLAACALTAIVEALALSARWIPEFSRAVLVIDWMLTLLGIAGIRVSIRVVGESRGRARGQARSAVASISEPGKRVLVIGAGEAGAMVVREMQRNPQLEMHPIGFLDDDRVKRGKQIYGVVVLGNVESLKRRDVFGQVDEVIIAMPTASGQAVRAVVERCQALGLPSRTIPGVFELLDGKIGLNRLRHVEISDLLRRPQIASGTNTGAYFTDRTVLVTGAGGSIGFELCRQVAYARPSRLVLLGHGENSLFDAHTQLQEGFPDVPISVVIADIRDPARMHRVFGEFKPDVVFHAAAHKHVHLMESNPEEAIFNNIVGTQNVVDAAIATGTERFVAISSDKAVSPNGLMGASKRIADMLVRAAGRTSDRSFVVVRFGNVLGSRGSVVPSFKRQIERGGPVTVTHPDMKRFFMTIAEAVHLVLEAGGMGKPGELFVLNMGEPVKIVSLAEDLIRLSGFMLGQVPIVFTGLRPGEKIEERLWERDSIVEPTQNSDILRVTERTSLEANVESVVSAFARAAAAGDRQTIHSLLKQYIPTFTHVSQEETRLHDAPTILKWNAGQR